MPSALLLMLAICSVWLPALPLPAGRSLAPWLPLLGLALALGHHDGQLDAIAVAGIVLLLSLIHI